MRSSNDDPYVEINRRMSVANGVGAGVITLLTVAAIWGQWHRLLLVLAIQATVIAFNTWVNLVLLPRQGRSAELIRTAVNLSTSVLVNHLAGWPVPVWLWLPFIALAFDHFERRIAVMVLAAFCVVQDTAALLAGVHWIYPLSFTALAVFCSEISRIRFSAIRDMLARSDAQRVEIERSHASLHEAHERLFRETAAREIAEHELRLAQKLEAVGRLAAGVAHEINTPVQFVNDSIHFLRDANDDLMRVIGTLQAVREAVDAGAPAAELAATAAAAEQAADLPFLADNVPSAFERCLEGLGRVATIVRSMKDFAHPDGREMRRIDLNRGIESTLVIARNEYKYVAKVESDLGELPAVLCQASDVNQAVLNLVVNAAHAIADAVRGSDRKGRITVRTRHEGEHVVISVSDDGTGIPEPVRERMFDPFFTTKEIGKGTGQGLAIVRSVVVDKHGGEVSVETEIGKGTTFSLRMPVDGRPAVGSATAA